MVLRPKIRITSKFLLRKPRQLQGLDLARLHLDSDQALKIKLLLVVGFVNRFKLDQSIYIQHPRFPTENQISGRSPLPVLCIMTTRQLNPNFTRIDFLCLDWFGTHFQLHKTTPVLTPDGNSVCHTHKQSLSKANFWDKNRVSLHFPLVQLLTLFVFINDINIVY